MVTACYIVIYHVADFPTGDKPVRHEDAYQSYDNAPISSGIFDDGTGGVWQLTVDSKWDYQCLGLVCSDCAYCDNGHCVVRSPVTEEERDIQIKSAKARMSETGRLSPQR